MLGTTWQVIANLISADKKVAGRGDRCRRRARPAGPTPGWSRQGQAPELRVQVDGLDRLARRPTPQVAEWFGEAPARRKACDQTADKTSARPTTPPTRPTPTRSATGRRRSSSAWTAAATYVQGLRRLDAGLDGDQGLSAAQRRRPGRAAPGRPWAAVGRRCTARPRLRLAGLLSAPMSGCVVAYLGLAGRRCSSPPSGASTRFTGEWSRPFTLDNFQHAAAPSRRLPHDRAAHARRRRRGDGHRRAASPCRWRSSWRRSRSRAAPGCLVVAVLTPLWASYLVKAYAWRVMLRRDGLVDEVLRPLGLDSPGYGVPGGRASRWPTCGCRS